MKSLKNLTGDSLEQLIDYNVVDQNGDEIGTLHSLWSDPDTGAVEFLGVKTGWLFGHNHVVPAGKAELDENANVVRLPYTEAFIKEAPSISADAEISEAEETNIYRYYGADDRGVEMSASEAGIPTSTSSGYAGVGASGVPEAAGAAGLANASGIDDGASRYAEPAAGSTGEDAGGASRWRRTSRPAETATGIATPSDTADTMTPRSELLADAASTVGDTGAGSFVRSALDDLSPGSSSGRRELLTTASPGAFGTANLYGSTGMNSPVSDDALGAPIDVSTRVAGGNSTTDPDAISPSATPVAGHPSTGEAGTDLREAGSANLDPITGEPGSHPVGTGVGALGAGAAGAAIGGAIGGPIGAPVGAVIGAIVGGVGGGLAGKGIAESINPTEEDHYWQSNFRNTSYFQNDYEYADYEPAYRTGYEGFHRHAGSGRDYAEVEPDLQRDYERTKGGSRLEWEKAKAATRDAWERLKAKTSNAAK